jgi:hypothetical protein
MVQDRVKERALNISSDEISDSVTKGSVCSKLIRAYMSYSRTDKKTRSCQQNS